MFYLSLCLGENIKLSAQEIVDCAPTLGCHGGSALEALVYIHHKGIRMERQYPYKGVRGPCEKPKKYNLDILKGFS